MGHKTEDELLTILIEEVNSIADYEAICVVEGGAHGHSLKHQIIQLKNGRFLRRNWSNLSEVEEKYDKRLHINLVNELNVLRQENSKMRVMTPKTDLGGRYATIYIAVKKDGDWIKCQIPLADKPVPFNAINRLLAAAFSIEWN